MPRAKTTKDKKPRDRSVVLSDSDKKFVEAKALNLSDKQAMAYSGRAVSESEAVNLKNVPKITQALLQERAKNAVMLGLTREDVLQGFMDAVDQAKVMADPMSQIAGWREIAKVCGFYAPEVKKVEISGAGKRILDKMAALSDEELLRIAQSELIEGECVEVQQ